MGEEYLWHPKVHIAFGEDLRFFFIRTAYTRSASSAFGKILEEIPTSSSAYLLVGQYEFLVRSWGTFENNNLLQQRLVERSLELLGNCLEISVKQIYYPWVERDPVPTDVEHFVAEINCRKKTAVRHEFISSKLADLKEKKLVLARMADREERQNDGLCAFTVIRNLKLSGESRKVIEFCLREKVMEYFGRGNGHDATLYSTADNFDFVIRWHTPDFKDFIKSLKEVILAVEDQGAATVFETYFVAERITPLRDNFAALIERVEKPSHQDIEVEWQKVVPSLKNVAPEIAQFLRLLCASPGVNLSVDAIKENRHLRGVLEGYLSGSGDQFGALVQQYYSNFETTLRNRLVNRFWLPREADELDKLKDEWCADLNRKEIPLGRDQGRTVPKLSLGDWLLLANQKFPERFDASTARRMQDLISMRNNLTHRGSGVIDLDYLPMFLGQAQSCARLLKAIDPSEQPKAIDQSEQPTVT